MTIPPYVEIGGHHIPVEIGPCDSDAIGEFYHYKKWKIVIEGDMDVALTEETLIHEIIEVANHIYELNLPHRTIQTLGAAIHQGLKPSLK